MGLDWILSPLTQGALVATGLGLALFLFCSLKIEMRAMERKGWAKAAPVEPPAAAREVEELEKRVDELAEICRAGREAGAGEGAVRSGLAGDLGTGLGMGQQTGINVERRIHALRRHRRGETAEQIARSLAVPNEEVRLLIKVHKILMERTVKSAQHDGRPSDWDREGAPAGKRALKPKPHSADMSQQSQPRE